MDMTEVEYKDPTTTLAHISSDPSRPVRPVLPTGRTGQHYLPTLPVRLVCAKQGGCTLSPKCTTRQSPSLRVSLHHFPPLCISADEFNIAGAEIDVRVSLRLLINTGVSGALGRLPTILLLRGLPLGLLWLRNHLVYDLLCRVCYTYAYAYDMRNVCMIS